MKALTLLALTVTLLLSAGCAGALPLEPAGPIVTPVLEGTEDTPVQKKAHCGGSAILSECKGGVPVLSDRR
jgi:hypothetical protein